METPDQPRARADWPAILAGCAITLAICGYQFGRSNHAVYLLEPLRLNDPTLLRNDWWTVSTLQYHGVFSRLTALLMRAGALEAAFFVMYLTLIALFQVAWWRLTTALGGGRGAYLTSILLYYLSAAGFGLGMYHVFQDSALLPSNLANVAILWAVALWIGGRFLPSAVCLGIAGMFHLNHAIVALLLWPALVVLTLLRGSMRSDMPGGLRLRDILIGTAAVGALCFISIIPALRGILAGQGSLPLDQFIDLYVRVRHPHHYDPSTWHPLLWLAFLWPFPLAIAYLRRHRDHPTSRRALLLLVLFLFTQVVALLCAGFWYLSEPLVQMSLYRFSFIPKLLACTMAAILLVRPAALQRRSLPTAAVIAFAAALAAIVALDGGRGLLTRFLPDDDPAYVDLCRWARQHTPKDAIFLVPPDEQSMRLHGQRAIVINFKGVPQLSAELPEWRTRLETLLAMDLRTLPGRMDHARAALAERYAALGAAHLLATADRYNARYIATAVDYPHPRLRLLHRVGRYHLYEIIR